MLVVAVAVSQVACSATYRDHHTAAVAAAAGEA
jgi:hypothetical protein